MALFLTSESPRLGIWKLDESAGELFARLSRREEYLPFLQRVKSERRHTEWLAVRVLLKELLGEEARIAYRPDGAPYLPDFPLFISISHTDGYVAVLLQEHPAAGIDIERRGDRVRRIRNRFLSDGEDAGVDPLHETDCLLVYWCAKEALFKMIGQAEVDFRDHLHIAPFPYAAQGEIEAWETRTEAKRAFQLHYRIFPDFILVHS